MPDHFYVYPAYLASEAGRRLGRRVKREIALEEVTAEELVAAARQLGYAAEAESERHYPRAASLFGGRVKVSKRPGVTKQAFLKELAAAVRKARPTAPKKA